jgi:hypothetical protein
VSDIDIDPSLLKGDFDPEKHEELVEKLAANFGDDELDENGEIMKVTFLASAICLQKTGLETGFLA